MYINKMYLPCGRASSGLTDRDLNRFKELCPHEVLCDVGKHGTAVCKLTIAIQSHRTVVRTKGGSVSRNTQPRAIITSKWC